MKLGKNRIGAGGLLAVQIEDTGDVHIMDAGRFMRERFADLLNGMEIELKDAAEQWAAYAVAVQSDGQDIPSAEAGPVAPILHRAYAFAQMFRACLGVDSAPFPSASSPSGRASVPQTAEPAQASPSAARSETGAAGAAAANIVPFPARMPK